MRFSKYPDLVALATLICLVLTANVQAGFDVGQVAIYDTEILGDLAVVIDEQTVAITNDGGPPAGLSAGFVGGVIEILEHPEEPNVLTDCDVVDQWPAVSLYFSNAKIATTIYGTTFSLFEAQAQGAVDLAVALLDSVNAPSEALCNKPVFCSLTLFAVAPLPGVPCRECVLNISNVNDELFGLTTLIQDMALMRDKAMDLVNSVLAKIANPGSFSPEDYACDRLCASKLQEEVMGIRAVFDLGVGSIEFNTEACTLELAMAECENCPESHNLYDIGPIISANFTTGAFQKVPPEPALVSLADSLERAARTGKSRALSKSLKRLTRRLRSVAEKGNVLHAVIPTQEEETTTYVAIGRGRPGANQKSGDEAKRPLAAVIITTAQRDSGLPAPNYNDSEKITEARKAFARRVPRETIVTLEDLAENETLNRIIPDWREFFR